MYGFGSPAPTNSSLTAHGGTNSLLATGRTDSWQGPAHDLPISTFAPGSTFHFSAWARVTDAEAANGDMITMSIKYTDASGDQYKYIGPYQTAITNTWVQLSGDYTIPAGATAVTLYFQLSSKTDDFFIDDVTITSATIAPPTGCAAQDNTGISSNFEDGTLQGWAGRGAATVTNVNTTAHGGVNSMYVTGRTANWNGAIIPVDNKMCVGSQYSISVWVKLDPADGQNHTINMSVETHYGTGVAYPGVASLSMPADGQWHQIKVPSYSMADQYDAGKAFLYLQTDPNGNDLTSFYMDDFQLTYLPPLQIEQNIASVAEHYANYFNIGAAVSQTDMSGAHSQLLAKHFNSITSGNDMKWDATEPTEGTFSYTKADAQVSFAQDHGMQVRGHTLLWHSQVPPWVFQKPGTTTPLDPTNTDDVNLLKTRLQNHIHNVMSHFGNKVYAWDVVNEVIDESQGDCMRRSGWYNIIGPSYIDLAFQYARAESPTAKLFINDYNSTIPNKRQCLYNLVQGMIERGVPVDGVGHQMHNNLWFPPVQQFIDTVNLFHGLTTTAQVPLDQQVTEFDESIYTYPPPLQGYDYDLIPTDLLVLEGYVYRDYFEAMKQLNSNPNDKKISSVTIWGMSDDETWLNANLKQGGADAPLLFDTKLQHKYAYTGIMDPLSLPGADLAVAMNADSTTTTPGSTVTFTVTVTNNGHDQAANVVLIDVLPGNLVFTSGSSPAGWNCTTPNVGSTGTITCTAATMDNATSAQFTLVATVLGGSQVTNTATVASDSRDPNPDASNNSASATLDVQIPAGMVSLNPTSLTFPATMVGYGTGYQKVTFTNRSPNAMTVTPTVSGPFMLRYNLCTGTIAPGAGCNLMVVYLPQLGGPESGTLSVSYTQGTAPVTAVLNGTGIAKLVVSSNALTFAATDIGNGAGSQKIAVLNRTGMEINVTPVIDTPIPGTFRIATNGCTAKLAPNAGCYLWVNYIATAAGEQKGTLTITPSAGTTAETVSLTGTGNAGQIIVTPTAVTYPLTNLGYGAGAQKIGILNRTGADITISYAIDTPVAGTFRVSTNGCTGTLAPNSGCYLWVNYIATASGEQKGTLTITPAGGGTAKTVSLTGTGN